MILSRHFFRRTVANISRHVIGDFYSSHLQLNAFNYALIGNSVKCGISFHGSFSKRKSHESVNCTKRNFVRQILIVINQNGYQRGCFVGNARWKNSVISHRICDLDLNNSKNSRLIDSRRISTERAE